MSPGRRAAILLGTVFAPVALVLLLLVSQAEASEDFSRPESSRMLSSLEVVAEEYWSLRGIALDPQVFVYRIADEPDAEAYGELGGSNVWITNYMLENLSSPDQYWRRYARESLCQVYIHERGHNAGLEHNSGDPIMVPLAPEIAPPRCQRWARTVGR